MGVDLTIIIEKYSLSGPILAYDRLSFKGRHYDLWEQLDAAGTPVTEGVEWYGDEGIEHRTTNPYGDPIKSLTAYQFVRTWDEFIEFGNAWDSAIVAFIRALPPTVKIILWFN
jgi:hypothetical protein